MTALDRPLTAGIGLVLSTLAHRVGWPFPRGGSDRLARAMITLLGGRGGEIVTGRRIGSLDELPPAAAILLDVTPRQVLGIVGERLPHGYRQKLARFRYGPAAFKVDWALDGPIPWRATECARAGTVHVGGTAEDALNYTRTMYGITLVRNADFALPALGFAGIPQAIDARRVVESGTQPVINTGIAHREPGIGQIGAGIARAPLAVFEAGLRALGQQLGVKEPEVRSEK